MTTRNKKNSDNAKMKTGTKVLIGVGAVGAAFAICYKWGPCRSFFAKGEGDYLLPIEPPVGSPAVNPADNIGTSGPMIASPTDFEAAKTNVSLMASFNPPSSYILASTPPAAQAVWTSGVAFAPTVQAARSTPVEGRVTGQAAAPVKRVLKQAASQVSSNGDLLGEMEGLLGNMGIEGDVGGRFTNPFEGVGGDIGSGILDGIGGSDGGSGGVDAGGLIQGIIDFFKRDGKIQLKPDEVEEYHYKSKIVVKTVGEIGETLSGATYRVKIRRSSDDKWFYPGGPHPSAGISNFHSIPVGTYTVYGDNLSKTKHGSKQVTVTKEKDQTKHVTLQLFNY